MKRAVPLALWLAFQTATLAVGASRVPLWARSGVAPQHLALAEMLAVQFAATALLFPSLLRGSAGIAATLTALPFVQLAAFLTSTPAAASIAVSVHVLLWMLGLTAWADVLRSKTSQVLGITIIGGITLGTPVMTYLARDFSEAAEHATWQLPPIANPISSVIQQASNSSIEAELAAAPTIVFLSGIIIFGVRSRKIFAAPSYPQPDSPIANNLHTD